MARLVGVLLMVLVLYLVLMLSFPYAFTLDNHEVLARRLGFYGLLTLGVGVLIVAGGIDLSIGSLVGLGAVTFGRLLEADWPPLAAALTVIAGAAVVGLGHGLLVTQLNLQPFLVTLCGLFMYRGLARFVAPSSLALPDTEPVESLRRVLVSGKTLGAAHELWLLLLVAGLLAVLLHGSVYGRYWYAIGCNEQAARYAGIATPRYKIAAYVLCSTLAGLGGVLFLLDYRNAQAISAGSLLELYAITGAVLGGCSLRGGEGTIPGMLLGAAVLPLLQQICTFSPAIGSALEYTVIGAALLLGTIGNELVARYSARRRT
jgi:ribose transport system permease protein